MRIRLALLRWFFSPPLLMGEGACMGIAWAYVLLRREPLGEAHVWPWLFLLIHSFILVKNLRGNPSTQRHGFIFSRGLSRDAVWVYTMLAHVAAVMAVWLPAALFIWLPIRSAFQETIYHTGYFPLFMPYEAGLPWRWLVGYAALMPVLHYAWLQRAQPTRGSESGDYLAAAFAVAGFSILLMTSYREPWVQQFAACMGLAIGILTLLLGWRLQRTMEV